MSLSINQDEVKATVAGIVKARVGSAAKLSAADRGVSADVDRVRKLKSLLTNLKAEIADAAEADPTVRSVRDTCSEYIGLADALLAKGEECRVEIRCAREHFQRDAFCVASAGGSQAGKSTTLQKIVGMDEASDPTCPIVGGGSGNSTTATRCRIVNIGTNDRGHARIEFFGRDEFFGRVIQPYCRELQKLGVPLPNMDSYDDFISFDVSEFEKGGQDRLSAVESSERAKKYYVRLCLLRHKVAEYEHLLDSPAADVEIGQAYRYLVYPSAKPQYNALPSLCHAVREATIYCRYPNPVVENIEFIDLPGAGEVAPDVEKRYAEGFNLKTDTVVYVSRYDGRIFGNEDVSMVDILGRVVPAGQLDNYMIHFQNDFHQVDGDVSKLIRVADINKGSKRDAYAIIGRGASAKVYRVPANTRTDQVLDDISRYEVPEIGPTGVVVVFGEGNDRDYVEDTLLPVICAFASKRLPLLDDALLSVAQAKADSVKGEVGHLVESALSSFRAHEERIPSTRVSFSNEVNRRVSELREALCIVRKQIDENYRGGTLLRDTMSRADSPQGIQESLESAIKAANSGLCLEADKSALMLRLQLTDAHREGLSGLLERYLRELRVTITDRFARLEDVYSTAIGNLLSTIFQLLADAEIGGKKVGVPFLRPTEDCGLLRRWIDALAAAGCESLANFARDLEGVEVKFYLTVYPDIRRKVFKDNVTDVYNRWLVGCTNSEERYEILRDLASDWAYATRECIVEKNAAMEIIYSAVERYFERTLFAAEADDELHRFVSFYWDELTGGSVQPAAACKGRLQSAIREIEAKCREA